MKNTLLTFHCPVKRAVKHKLSKIPMLALVLLLMNLMPVQATSPARETKVSIHLNETTLKQVLYEVERQSKKSFFYSSNQINTRRKVSIDLNGSLEDVLTKLFDDAGVSWQINGKHIVLKKKPEPEITVSYNQNRSEKETLKLLSSRTQLTKNQGIAVRVNGSVRDDKNDPLPGVSIVQKGTQNGAISDQDGKFSIEVPDDNAILIFSFVGYIPQEIKVGNQSNIDVALQTDTKALSEVIVVGYGTVKKENLTSSISKIGTESIQGRPISTLSDAFAG